MSTKQEAMVVCDFCGTDQHSVDMIVATHDGKAHICCECVLTCVKVCMDKTGKYAQKPGTGIGIAGERG